MISKWFEAESFIFSKDVLTITETKLDSSIPNQSINPNDFFINRTDRNIHGGGVITYIKPSFKAIPMDAIQTKFNGKGLEVTVSKIIFQHIDWIIIGMYRPPNSRREWFEAFRELILELVIYGKLVLMRDLNCDLLKPSNPSTRTLLNILEMGSLAVKQGQDLSPTRITITSATCIDLVAIDKSITIDRYEVSDLLISDHHPVEADILLSQPKGYSYI